VEIDTLRDPKVLTNFDKIDIDGTCVVNSSDVIEFWSENGDLKQNLLIKGNNLIVLYSLRQKLAGKIKLIYIDPPYNT
jgi:adenine-specific DNA-methyltransferase